MLTLDEFLMLLSGIISEWPLGKGYVLVDWVVVLAFPMRNLLAKMLRSVVDLLASKREFWIGILLLKDLSVHLLIIGSNLELSLELLSKLNRAISFRLDTSF